ESWRSLSQLRRIQLGFGFGSQPTAHPADRPRPAGQRRQEQDQLVEKGRMTTVTLARHAMATRFEIVLHGENPVALRAAGEEALEEIDRLENQLSLYRPTSEIAYLNAKAAFGPV